ncbi:MAG: TRC40/GET3/ArsA family transport-energizing ATPase [Chloroflexota bacterium]|nr:TRC40/GET3/ArsA family transport-energizing ATPase [Chloroflexota bacterium]
MTKRSPRILLYTGKGGVGKTSVAAAAALRCADAGLRTVVLSTDTAHSLGDSLDTPLGPVPKPVVDNLWAQECDVYYNLETYWGTVQNWVEAVLTWRGMDNVLAEEIAVFPGMEELANLLWVNRHASSGEYDVVVVDCAPTGETLRLLAFPEVGRWWLDKLLPINRHLARMVRPMARRVTDLPLPEDDVFEAMTDLVDELQQLHDTLTASNTTTVRLVVNPEKMVIREAQRSYTYLTLYDHITDAVVVNRVVSEEAEGRFAEQRRAMQAPYLQDIHAMFDPIPILRVHQFSHEVVGLDRLRVMGAQMHATCEPSDRLIDYKPYEIVEVEGGFEFRIPAPFLEKSDASLVRRGDELVIRMGAARRNIVLPRVLARMTHSGARLVDGQLRVRFSARPTAAAPPRQGA